MNHCVSVPFVSSLRDELIAPRHAPPSFGAPPLEALGIRPEDVAPRIAVSIGASVDLASMIRPRIVTTRSLAQYKEWIGRPDSMLDSHSSSTDPYSMPSREWSGRRVHSLSELAPQERMDVERAARIYIFFRSELAESYRSVIEALHAPFRAAVYAMRLLRVAAASRVIVSGEPAVLVADEVVLEDGGQLVLSTACRAWFGRLEKIEATTH